MVRSHSSIKNYTLNAKSIDAISEEIVNVCAKQKTDKRTVTRYRLSAEEILLSWQSVFGEDKPVILEFGTKILKPYFSISVEGEQVSPYDIESEDFGSNQKSMLVRLGIVPLYSYKNGKNILTFNLERRHMNQFLSLFITIFAALLVGILGNLLISDSFKTILTEDLISPIENAFFNILSCIAGPMIFLSVAWGVYGIGDVYTLGRVGKKMMVNFLSVALLCSCYGALFFPILGPSFSSQSIQSSQLGKILQMILDIFPSNIFSPFIEGNTLQIIFLAFIIGLSLIYLGQRTSSVAKAVEQINHIITFLMTSISKLVPCFIFVVIVQMIWSGKLSMFSSIWKFSLIFLGAYIILLTVFTLFVSIRDKIKFTFLVRSILPSYIIALTTASSAATFESNMSICQNKFGVKNSITSFGVPFGMVLFKPNVAMYYVLCCFYFAKVASVPISISWILVAILVSMVGSVATAPIPGGAAATYTILFMQLGIPTECLPVVFAIDMIFDFVLTSGDMYCLVLEITHVAGKLGMRDTTQNGRKQIGDN